ncbi:MAG TPA: nidogen-like domain-containing protein, partial [Bacteroidia bacterium]|nr:nidogen-like domain-containing protein [Bacteroidia bacterium]
MQQNYKRVNNKKQSLPGIKGLFTFLLPLCLFLFSFLYSNKTSAQVNCSCWKIIDTSFHVVPFGIDSDGGSPSLPPLYRNDDGSTLAFKIPFNFCFWGTPMDTVYINNNGTVSFHQAYSSFIPKGFPLTNYDMIAPFWADVDTRNPKSGVVYYKLTPTYLIVQWDTVGYFSTHVDKKNSFQVIMSNGSDPIIPNGNNVEFCYQTMNWTTGDASGGHLGYGGHPATVGANEGDGINYVQFGLFDTAGVRYLGAYPPRPFDGVGWLDNQSFIFSTCVSNIGPIVRGISPCDTFILCTGDTADIHVLFISPKKTDTTSAGILPPILPGESILSNTPGNTDTIAIRIIGGPGNYGYHTINVYGYTTNTSPPDTTFSSFVLEVDSSAVGSIVASKDTICLGDSTKLKAIANVNTYLWSTGQTTDSIEVKPAVTTTYTLQLAKGKCDLILTKTIVVVASGIPSIKISPDSICKGDSSVISAGGGGTYKWEPGGATTASITVKPATTTTYSVLITEVCTNDTITLTKTLHIIPPPAVITSKDTTICAGASATISASGGTKYLWSPGGSTNSTITVSP